MRGDSVANSRLTAGVVRWTSVSGGCSPKGFGDELRRGVAGGVVHHVRDVGGRVALIDAGADGDPEGVRVAGVPERVLLAVQGVTMAGGLKT